MYAWPRVYASKPFEPCFESASGKVNSEGRNEGECVAEAVTQELRRASPGLARYPRLTTILCATKACFLPYSRRASRRRRRRRLSPVKNERPYFCADAEKIGRQSKMLQTLF